MNACMTPACFESLEQYRDWLRLCRESRDRVTICVDCLPEYQQEMVTQRRCAKPGMTFIAIEGGIIGRRM